MERTSNTSNIPMVTPSYPETVMQPWLIRSIDVFNGILALYIAAFGALWNLIAVSFFLRSKKDLIKIIYIWISFTDLTACIMMTPVGIANLNLRNPNLFSSVIFCNAHGFLWNVTARLTVFLVMVLSITRTIFLKFPFWRICTKKIIATIVIYTIFQVIQASLPFIVSTLYIIIIVVINSIYIRGNPNFTHAHCNCNSL